MLHRWLVQGILALLLFDKTFSKAMDFMFTCREVDMPMILKQLWTRSTRIIIRRSCRILALILKQQCLSKMMVPLMKIFRWVHNYCNEIEQTSTQSWSEALLVPRSTLLGISWTGSFVLHHLYNYKVILPYPEPKGINEWIKSANGLKGRITIGNSHEFLSFYKVSYKGWKVTVEPKNQDLHYNYH